MLELLVDSNYLQDALKILVSYLKGELAIVDAAFLSINHSQLNVLFLIGRHGNYMV